MGNAGYIKGAAAERKIVKFFRDRGYTALRSAGSHSPIDVVAISDNDIVFIQSKFEGSLSLAAEKEKLQNLPCPSNVRKQLWVFRNRQPPLVYSFDNNNWMMTTPTEIQEK